MKRHLTAFLCIIIAQICTAQNVYLNKIEKTNNNTDTFFYTLTKEETKSAEYLGEIEVQGFSADDAAVFSAVYKKAKEIGGNTFSFKPFESLDGSEKKLDPSNYKLAVYYLQKEKLSDAQGNLYLFASSQKEQKISVNKKDYVLQPRSYLKIPMADGDIYTVSTKKLLGSTIKVKKNAAEENQYYQISSAKIGGSEKSDGTLHIKSGDITGLEAYFANFLSVIYTDMK